MNYLQNKAQQAVKSFRDRERNRSKKYIGQLGDGHGNVTASRGGDWVYVRLSGQNNKVVLARNTGKITPVEGLIVDLVKTQQTGGSHYASDVPTSNITYSTNPTYETVGLHARQHELQDFSNGGYDAINVYEPMIVPLRAAAQSVPNLTLHVEHGFYLLDGVLTEFTATDSPAFTAIASAPMITLVRWDLLYLLYDGTLHIAEGTAVVSPAVPAYPATPSNSYPLKLVWRYSGQTVLTNAYLRDARPLGAGMRTTGVLVNASAQYHVPVSGPSPFAYAESGFLLDGTTGGKTVLAVSNTKTLTLTATDNRSVTFPILSSNTDAITTSADVSAGTSAILASSSGLLTLKTLALLETSQVYCVGDSLTDNGGYEARLSTLLNATGQSWGVPNMGHGGDTTTMILARYSDVTGQPDVNAVVILAGINDVLAGTSAATIEANLQTMYTAAHAISARVVAVTLTPFKGNSGWSAGKQTVLDTVNTWILSTAIDIDDRVDAYTDLEDPGVADTLLGTYDSGDHLHLSVAGYTELGSYIYAHATWVHGSGKYSPLLSSSGMFNQNLRQSDSPKFAGLTVGYRGITVIGNLTADTNTLFVDSANHKVGLFTTTPSLINFSCCSLFNT